MSIYQKGYSDMMEKLSVSPELAKAVLIGKALGMSLKDVARPGGYSAQVSRKKIIDYLKKFPRTIRRAGPEARLKIYGPPQIEAPTRWANLAWKPEMATAGKMHTHRLLGLR